MEIGSKAMSFRFDAKLIELVKERARMPKSSLNKYQEYPLNKYVRNIPNEETVAVIEKAKKGNMETISNIGEFF